VPDCVRSGAAAADYVLEEHPWQRAEA